MLMFSLAADEHDESNVAIGALEPLLRESGDVLLPYLRKSAPSDQHLQNALRRIYMRGAVKEWGRKRRICANLSLSKVGANVLWGSQIHRRAGYPE